MEKEPYVTAEAKVALKLEPQAAEEEKQLFAWICRQMETEEKKGGDENTHET